MTGYTLEELVKECLDFQFSEIEYEALFKKWLNQAQRRAVIESEIRTQEATEGIATVAGTASYGLPANYARMIDFSDPGVPRLLSQLDLKEFDSTPASEGRPCAYAVIGNTLSLLPTPNGAYPLQLRYWRLPADMTQPSDMPEIPGQYHELLPAFALKKAYLRENDTQMAQTWEVQWEKAVAKMRGEVQSDSLDGPRQVGGTWGDPRGAVPYTWGG